MKILFAGLAVALLSGQAVAASIQEARQWLETLNQAVEKSNQVMQSGDSRQVALHSREIIKLRDSGEKFGTSALDKPFGHCFMAGVALHAWWQAVVGVIQSGKESPPGVVDRVAKWYAESRKDCLFFIEEEERLAGPVKGSRQGIKSYVQSLDDAVNAFKDAPADERKIIPHGKHMGELMGELVDEGKKLGGSCFRAGRNAQKLWLTAADAARATEDEKKVPTDEFKQAAKSYADARLACLNAVGSVK